MKSHKVYLESRPALDCFQIVNNSFELARCTKVAWEINHHCVTGITFTAFSIEAMFNHFGQIYFPDWYKLKLCRKQFHKKLFEAVNLPEYLGTKNYQNAKKCFAIRDLLAHGKTKDETIDIDIPKDLNHDELVYRILEIPSKAFRQSDIKVLELFIETAQNIEKDIQKYGYYPSQYSHNEKLMECPLSVTGVRTRQI